MLVIEAVEHCFYQIEEARDVSWSIRVLLARMKGAPDHLALTRKWWVEFSAPDWHSVERSALTWAYRPHMRRGMAHANAAILLLTRISATVLIMLAV